MNARSKKTQIAVLEASYRLLLKKGVNALQMQTVAQAASVSRQAVYLRFESRSGLLLALVDYIAEKVGGYELFASIAWDDDPLDVVNSLLSALVAFSPNIYPVSELLDAARRTDAAAAQAWDDRMSQRRELFLRQTRRLARAGRLAEGWTAQRAADALWSMCSPRAYQELVVDRGWSLKAYENYLFSVFHHAILASG